MIALIALDLALFFVCSTSSICWAARKLADSALCHPMSCGVCQTKGEESICVARLRVEIVEHAGWPLPIDYGRLRPIRASTTFPFNGVAFRQ
jgi:hypothetical protein